MLYFIYRVDKPNSAELREATRPAHLEWAKTLGDRLRYAGPTLDEESGAMIGSVWMLEAESRDEAARITQSDPYEKAALFESKTVQAFMQVVPWDE